MFSIAAVELDVLRLRDRRSADLLRLLLEVEEVDLPLLDNFPISGGVG